MTKAWATVVVPNRSITMVTTHSAMLFRVGAAAELLAVFKIFVLAGIGVFLLSPWLLSCAAAPAVTYLRLRPILR